MATSEKFCLEKVRPVVYVAGPYSPRGFWQRWPLSTIVRCFHVLRAAKISTHLWRLGYAVICPHANTYFSAMFAPDLPQSYWLDGDLSILERCDALMYLGSSPGADIELSIAKQCGLIIWDDLHMVPEAAIFSDESLRRPHSCSCHSIEK